MFDVGTCTYTFTRLSHFSFLFVSLSLCIIQPADSCRAKELEECAQLLVFKFNHRQGRIKQVADKYLTKLIDK